MAVWYPALTRGHGEPMPYRRYLALLGSSMPATGPASAEESLVQRWSAAGIASEAIASHLATETPVLLESPPADGPFPLLVFSPMMLSSALSNTVLCEYLASHGYVVAAHPSYGAGPERMTTGLVDLERQARDLEFVIATLEGDGGVDPASVGVFGHSWGGMAALLAASRNSKIQAVVSLDGSEEMWRDLLDAAPEFDPALLKVPYLRLTNPPSPNSPDNGLFASIGHSWKARVLLDATVGHFDFVASASLRHRLRGSPELAEKLRTLGLVGTYVRTFFDASLKDLAAARERLGDVEYWRAMSETVEQIQVWSDREPVPTDEELFEALAEGGLERLKSIYRGWLARDAMAFSEGRLLGLAEELLWSARHDEEALEILRWTLERFPESSEAHEMMGNVYYWNRGDSVSAEEHYRAALELDPDDLQLKTYLSQMAAGRSSN